MRFHESSFSRRCFLRSISLLLPAAFAPGVARAALAASADAPADPWTPEQKVQPAALAKELAESKSADRPTIVCVAPHAMYIGGHINGALYHGPGGSADGIADLKKWAESEKRSTSIVTYCGCCPMERCPNLRPAFVALRDMGFTHLRALVIPTNFYTDWVQPGYPYEKPPAN
jgi:thiosulfate/3-mercaptopyruvate sulfurtransferase